MRRAPTHAIRAPRAASIFAVVLLAAPWLLHAQTTTPATPATPQDDNTMQPAETTFAGLDADGDGFVSKAEVPANDPLQSEFMKLDENGDDKLSQDEFDNRK